MHGDQIKYSFVSMLISLSNLLDRGKVQMNVFESFKVRPVGLINVNTNE